MRFILVLATCLLLARPSFGQTEEKNPWVALGLSSLIPGAGQLYNDEPHKGILLFSGGFVGYLMIHQAFEDKSQSALEIVPVVIPGRAGARVVMRF